MVDPFGSWLLPAMMFGLMFAMGLALTPSDFRRIAQVPGPVVLGTVLQLVGMPLVGFGLALAYALPPLLAVGLVVCAACPGGLGSNLFVHFGRANTALSITLTATATTVTLFTLPFWIRAIQATTGTQAGEIEVPLFDTMIELAGLTVVPVAAGMVTRHIQPGITRHERWLSLAFALGLVAVAVGESADRPDVPLELFYESLPPALWLAAAALATGFAIPKLAGQTARDAVTIAVELCVKNALLGIVVVSTSFRAFDPNIPLFVYSAVMVPPAILALVIDRIRAGRHAEAQRTPEASP